jgi:peptidoglycan-associated lipoprotein
LKHLFNYENLSIKNIDQGAIMKLNKILKNTFLVMVACFVLSACATSKKTGQLQSDVYTGKDTVEYLASGVPDRVFFATNKSSLTTASRATLRKQATYLRKNKKLNVTIEGHADERGTREYNLALGERRANAARDYLMTYGISGKRISVISYGKEKPVNAASTPLAWSQNRRSVTVKVN